MRKPQGGLLSYCYGSEKIIMIFNSRFVTEFAILKSNYSAMKWTWDMKPMAIIGYILLYIIGYLLCLGVKCIMVLKTFGNGNQWLRLCI